MPPTGAQSREGGLAIVRPYDDRFRKHVMELLERIGVDVTDPRVLAVGTGDAEAARWLADLSPPPSVVLMPFHEHTSEDGEPVDGLAVAAQLSPTMIARRVPILMPVSDFAWAAKFQRRFEELRRERPRVAELIVAVPASQLLEDDTREALAAHLS